MAIKYEGSFLSEADTLEISVLCLMPEPGIKPRAIVQLVHGMSEHKERYIPFMEYLTDKYLTRFSSLDGSFRFFHSLAIVRSTPLTNGFRL